MTELKIRLFLILNDFDIYHYTLYDTRTGWTHFSNSRSTKLLAHEKEREDQCSYPRNAGETEERCECCGGEIHSSLFQS